MPDSEKKIRDKSGGAGQPKAPTRKSQLNKLLARKSGATIAQLQKAFGWQPHTAWAAISVQRRAGCVITRADGDKGAVYRLVSEAVTYDGW